MITITDQSTAADLVAARTPVTSTQNTAKPRVKTERWIKGGGFRQGNASVNRRECRARGYVGPLSLKRLTPYQRTVPKTERKAGESRFIYV